MRPTAAVIALGAGVAALAAGPRPAAAYEFEAHARTIVQGFELRSLRLHGPDLVLARRRFTQALGLEIVDIGDLAAARRRARSRAPGPEISLSAYLRIDHDFGDWTMGSLPRGAGTIDAIDVIPELEASSLAMDLLYAHVDVRGLARGRIDLRLGRQVRLDLLDAAAIDGVTATVRTPWRVALEATAGARVRDASPLGPAAYELDGTSGAACREYVEGPAPGTGSWQLIDRSRVPGQGRFTSDLEYCPQRLVWMPTVGLAAETDGLRRVHARLAYRRTSSPTVGRIGAIDRLDHPDLGLYPNELGQAPAWGVNEERLSLLVDGRVEARGGRVIATPWAGARWSLLHGVIDEAVAGARVRLGAHAVEPELARSVPTFDGDSIFSVFASGPATDARLGWSYAPRGGAVGARAGVWARRYELDAGERAHAGGATAAGEWRGGPWRVRVDALADGGWGGRRAGGGAQVRWRAGRRAAYTARGGALATFDTPARDAGVARDLDAVHGHAALGGTWQLADGVGLHVVAEGATSRITPAQLRAIAVVDLAFVPEL